MIIEPLAYKHHFKDKEMINLFQKRVKLDLRELILAELKKVNFIEKDDLLNNSNFSYSDIMKTVNLLEQEGKLIANTSWLIDKNYWQEQILNFMKRLSQEYELSPLQTGFPLNKI